MNFTVSHRTGLYINGISIHICTVYLCYQYFQAFGQNNNAIEILFSLMYLFFLRVSLFRFLFCEASRKTFEATFLYNLLLLCLVFVIHTHFLVVSIPHGLGHLRWLWILRPTRSKRVEQNYNIHGIRKCATEWLDMCENRYLSARSSPMRCALCQRNIIATSRVYRLMCQHEFHRTCFLLYTKHFIVQHWNLIQ